MQRREHQLVELVRMFEAFGIEPSASRIDIYLEVLGDPDPMLLHDAVVQAIRDGGDFPPAAGVLHQHLEALRRARRPAGPVAGHLPAQASGPSPDEQRVMRELWRRLAERPRQGELVNFRVYLADRRAVQEQLAQDLIALAAAQNRRRA